MKKMALLIFLLVNSFVWSQTGAVNIDFETGNFNGWQPSRGINNNSIMPLSSTVTAMTPGIDIPANNCFAGLEHSIMSSTSTIDPVCMQSLVSPLGGNYMVRLNRFCGGMEGAMLTKAIPVNLTNSKIYVAYMVILESPGTHTANDQPYFRYDILDYAGNVLSGNSYSSHDPSGTFTDFLPIAGVLYKPWTLDTIDILPYIGQTVTLRFISAGCPQATHSGYAYIDASLTGVVTDINHINKQTINFYPNPTNESLFLSLPVNDNLNYEIIDLLGRVVIKKEHLIANTINVTGLSKGTYILKGELNGNFIAQKFMKN